MAVQVPHSGGTQLRSLEKVLDEAQKSGKLNLNGRNLRDYPKSADKYDLLDTVEIDLSKNKLAELPCEICAYTALQRVNCYNNVIRVVPPEIINLTALSYLNLSRNQLSVLPMQICDLFLEVLILSNNKLVSLPPEIGKLRTLMLLDASCNELDNLPMEIGEMEALKELNIRRNHLVTLPEEICKLKLVKLDISCNKIQNIPPCYRTMDSLDVFEVDHNPLSNPPAQVCTRGRVHIFKYLATEAVKADKRRGMIEQHMEWNSSRNPYSTNMADEISLFNHKIRELGTGIKMADSGYLEGDKRWSSSEPSTEDEEAKYLAERASQQKEKRQQKFVNDTARTFKPNDNHIDFIDAGDEEEEEEEDGVTPTQSPIQTPTLVDVDPFTKELERQKAMYEEKKRQAREERLRLEVEEQKKKEDPVHLGNDVHAPVSKETGGVRRLSNESRIQKPTVIIGGSGGGVDERRIGGPKLANGSSGATTNGNSRRTLSSASSTSTSIGRPKSLYVDKKVPRRATVGGSADSKRASTGDKYGNINHSLPMSNGKVKRASDSDTGLVGGGQISPERHKAQVTKRTELEEKNRTKQAQRDAVLNFYKTRTSMSPTGKKEDTSSNNSKNSPGSAFSSIKPRSAFNIGGGKGVGEGLQTNFTAKRERTKWAEELERIEQLRKSIESRLKVSLPEDLAEALMDGVVLCHLSNNIKPHAISSIHIPSAAAPKLSAAKSRRNVDSFLKVCVNAGVPAEKMCTPSDVLEGKGLPKVAATVKALLSHTAVQTKQWAV
ncbi:DISP complex protein LRCH3-like [Diadema setosum]|uniref:DISP complex protein LRCH3-like n=1 Tax=Diadema setosum TaxID=31175 RepID=UPI003B3A1831